MEKKGQSALEYLMTYGWALIVIAIVIGVLVFIMSTTTAGANCTSDNTQVIYVDHAVVAGVDGVTVKLQNGAGQTITLDAITPDGVTFTGAANEVGNDVTTGSEFTVTGLETTGIAGANYRGSIAILYTRGTGGIQHTATVTCTGVVG